MFRKEFLIEMYQKTFFDLLNADDFKPEELFGRGYNFLDYTIYYISDSKIGLAAYLKHRYTDEYIFFIINKSEWSEIFLSNNKKLKSLNDFFNFSYFNYPILSHEKKFDFWIETKDEQSFFENILKRALNNWRINDSGIIRTISYYIAWKLSENKKTFSYTLQKKIAKKHAWFLFATISNIWDRARDKNPFVLGKNHVLSLLLFKNTTAHIFKFNEFDLLEYYEQVITEYEILKRKAQEASLEIYGDNLTTQDVFTREDRERRYDIDQRLMEQAYEEEYARYLEQGDFFDDDE